MSLALWRLMEHTGQHTPYPAGEGFEGPAEMVSHSLGVMEAPQEGSDDIAGKALQAFRGTSRLP